MIDYRKLGQKCYFAGVEIDPEKMTPLEGVLWLLSASNSDQIESLSEKVADMEIRLFNAECRSRGRR